MPAVKIYKDTNGPSAILEVEKNEVFLFLVRLCFLRLFLSFVRRDSLARSDGWIGGGGPCSLGPVLFVPSIAGFAVVTPEATEGRTGKKERGEESDLPACSI